MIKFKFTETDTEYYNRWFSFHLSRNKGVGFDMTLSTSGYFDPRPHIHTNLTTIVSIILPFISLWLIPITLFFWFWSWGSMFIYLPYDTGRNNTAEYKTYGVMFYHPDSGFPNECWVRGFNKLSFYFPWAYKFDKREVLTWNGWYTERKGDDTWDKEKWKDTTIYSTYPYTYNLKSGKIQEVNATIYQEKRTWKNWFGLHKKIRKYIEVEFDKEVGERSGSWKGGCTGCSYETREGETGYEALRRMEQERKF